MTATAPLKKSLYMKKWLAQADPPKEANTIKNMNGRLLLLSSNKTTHYFKEWTTVSGVLKKIYCLLIHTFKFDAANRSIPLTVAVPRNKSTPKEN